LNFKLSLFFRFVVAGRDVIAQAQSGTGKTATFAISILQNLDAAKLSCQALVLAPTRELAQQIQKVNYETRFFGDQAPANMLTF
jgi:superfamily II DNA/RNA helicase